MSVKKLFVLSVLALISAWSHELMAQKTFCFVEWNVENLFDPQDDPKKKDDDFLPEAPRAWTWTKFWRKLNHMSKLLVAAGEGAPPDVVALCEVENDSVLTDLTKYSALRRVGYEYLMTHSEDVRGINVALLYNPLTFKVLQNRSIRPDFSGLSPKKTRDVLHITGMVMTGDTLDVFVCHWPSRLDRRRQGQDYRMCIARQLRRVCDSLMRVRQQPNIILTGDFNDTPTDASLLEGLKARGVNGDVEYPEAKALYNLMYGKKVNKEIKGTYCFRGNWEILDHFIVNGRLLDRRAKMHTRYANCGIFAPDFLLTELDGKFLPWHTYNGYKYAGGFSDHLPVVVKFDYSW